MRHSQPSFKNISLPECSYAQIGVIPSSIRRDICEKVIFYSFNKLIDINIFFKHGYTSLEKNFQPKSFSMPYWEGLSEIPNYFKK
jgi:hypothetical protein